MTVKRDTEKVPTNTLFLTPKKNVQGDYGRLAKGEGGLVCSEQDALLQLQQV